MGSNVIDGKALAKKHENALREKLSAIKKDRNPSIVSFCNKDDPPSVLYTRMKHSKAADIGIDFKVEEYAITTSKDEIVEKIQRYNSDLTIDGIMLQLPIPDELNIFQRDFLEMIDPQKDVDGLTGKGPFLPATVKAVISVLDECVEGWQNKTIAIVGSEGEIGKSLVSVCNSRSFNLNNSRSCIEVDKNIGNLETNLKGADIVISATGQPGLIKPEMISKGVVLVDVGLGGAHPKLGDFDPECFEKASMYTPKFGGVGPMTVISLMENTVRAFS